MVAWGRAQRRPRNWSPAEPSRRPGRGAGSFSSWHSCASSIVQSNEAQVDFANANLRRLPQATIYCPCRGNNVQLE
jgi:hypothetical protein